MKGLVGDVRHALRVYARTPVASGLAVIVLAVAMAFVVSFLSLYIDLVYQPNPGFEESGELISVGQNNGQRIAGMSLALLERINEEVGSLNAAAGFYMTNVQIGPEREQRPVEMLSPGFFSELRARLELGRGLDARDHDPDAEPVAVIRLSDRVAGLFAADRARSLLTIGSALLVLVLAGFGFYGTQRYLVAAGRREYAIRASIGAGPKALGRLVIGRGLALGLPGIALGGLLAFIVSAWLRDDFVSREISPGIVTAAVVAGLVALLLAAGLGPARQARRTEPAPLLREE